MGRGHEHCMLITLTSCRIQATNYDTGHTATMLAMYGLTLFIDYHTHFPASMLGGANSVGEQRERRTV